MLKHLSQDALEKLGKDLRRKIIDVCAANGGHIGASLGAVELTLALHAEFDSPRDSIVWDIGHQSYAHKMITRAPEKMELLRKRGGPSGFTSRAESPHDIFGAGHSSTSISAALGIAEAKRIQKEDSWTIAVIGDGALTAGLAFEALNQAGISREPRLIIVVNDNNLSISPNVGALNTHAFGAEREPRKFFDSLGFDYSGPIDGHDIRSLRAAFDSIKKKPLGRVSVLHVLTVKGKGFEPAEKEPVRFHGVGPFDKLTGRSDAKSGAPTYSQAFGSTLVELAEQNKDLVAITAAMAEGTGLTAFAQRFPERFYDVGIAEPHALLFAAGLAARGLRPVVALYSTFLQRAIDSAIHDIALQNLNVVLGIDRAGLVGADGPTHHGAFDIAILRAIPGVSIAAPSCVQDLKQILALAVRRNGLNALRYPRGAAPVAMDHSPVDWGKARIKHKASDPGQLVVWALGEAVNWTQEAISKLSPTVRDRVTFVDAIFAKPLDRDILRETLRGASALVTVEDGICHGGFGSAVLETAVQSGIRLPERIKLMGMPDRWIEHAETREQRDEAALSERAIGDVIKKLLG